MTSYYDLNNLGDVEDHKLHIEARRPGNVCLANLLVQKHAERNFIAEGLVMVLHPLPF